MTARDRHARRLRRLVAEAERDGVAFVDDSDACAVRVLDALDLAADDLRRLGDVVQVAGGCGGALLMTSTDGRPK